MASRRAVRRLAAAVAGFFVGGVAGSSVAVMLLGGTVDQLTIDNARLMDEVETLDARLALLDTRGARGGPYVEAVEVSITGVERARVPLEQAVKQLIGHIVGEELHRVNASTLHAAVERSFTLDQQRFDVEVRYIYIAPTVRLDLVAEPSPIGETGS